MSSAKFCPDAKLHVAGGARFEGNVLIQENGGNPYFMTGDDGDNNVFLTWDSTSNYGKIQVQTGGTASATDV